MDESVHAGGTHQDVSLQHPIPPNPFPPMLLPAPASSNTPTMLNHASPKHLATLSKIGSMTYNQEENGYNLEWESQANFNQWLTHEQAAIGIEIQVSKTWQCKVHQVQLYSTCETFHCVQNEMGGKLHYMKKTTYERKIKSKRIKGGCPCYIQIKTYHHINTILGKYKHKHFHSTGKDNLKYIWIWVSMQKLIESWVHYGVTDQEIVSDPLLITTDLTKDI